MLRSTRPFVLLLTAALLCGCSGGAVSDPPPEPDVAASLSASVVQLRLEENTSTLHVRILNNGDGLVTVLRSGLAGPALMSAPARPVNPDLSEVAPGGLMTAPGTFADPDCEHEGAPALATAVLADGTGEREVLVAVDEAGQLVVDRIVARSCVEQRVAALADVRLDSAWRQTDGPGGPALAGDLLIRPEPGAAPGALRVAALTGSVLLNLRADGDVLPADLGTGPGRVPVEITPTGRCDGHALASSQQTFLLNVYLSLDGAEPVRLVVEPDPRTQRRAMVLVREVCGLNG